MAGLEDLLQMRIRRLQQAPHFRSKPAFDPQHTDDASRGGLPLPEEMRMVGVVLRPVLTLEDPRKSVLSRFLLPTPLINESSWKSGHVADR